MPRVVLQGFSQQKCTFEVSAEWYHGYGHTGIKREYLLLNPARLGSAECYYMGAGISVQILATPSNHRRGETGEAARHSIGAAG